MIKCPSANIQQYCTLSTLGYSYINPSAPFCEYNHRICPNLLKQLLSENDFNNYLKNNIKYSSLFISSLNYQQTIHETLLKINNLTIIPSDVLELTNSFRLFPLEGSQFKHL